MLRVWSKRKFAQSAHGERIAVDKLLGFSRKLFLDGQIFSKQDFRRKRGLCYLKNTEYRKIARSSIRLNLEVKASLQEPVNSSRDSRLVFKQEKVAICLAILRTFLSDLLKGQTVDKLLLLKKFSDMRRLLVDLQRKETLTRKALILPNLNASVKETLKATIVDE